MSCEAYREDIEAYALGALDEDRRREVERHTSECAECTDLARAYETAVQHLALTVPLYHAAPRLKQRIMGGIGSARQPL